MRLRTHSLFAGTYSIVHSTEVKSFMPATTKTLVISRKKISRFQDFKNICEYYFFSFLHFFFSLIYCLTICRLQTESYCLTSIYYYILLSLRTLRESHGLSPATFEVSYGIGFLSCSALILSQIGYFFFPFS